MGYWHNLTQSRISRRRALAGGAAGAGTLLLAACGSSSSSSAPSSGAPKGDQSGLVTKPEDAGKQAKPGGVLKDFTTSDPITLDPLNPVNPLNVPAARVYSTLVREKPGALEGSRGAGRRPGGVLGDFTGPDADHPQAAPGYELARQASRFGSRRRR